MAVKVNELKQVAIEAEANVTAQEHALDALLDSEAAAKKTYSTLLTASAAGTLKAEDEKKLTEAEAVVNGFPARLSAQRKLVAVAKADASSADVALKAETERIAAEDRVLKVKPSGRIEVQAPNADKDPKRGFADHGDYTRAVMKAGMGMGVDERLKPLATQGSDEQQVGSNPYGGYFVPVAIAGGVLKVAPEVDPLDQYVRKVPMASPTVKFNARVDKNHATSVSGGFRVYRRVETVDATTSRGAFEQVTLSANEETGAAIATESCITDSPESFVAIIQGAMGDEFIANKMNERINGTGTGERQGILNAGCLITVAADAEQDAATITVNNIDNMAARSWRYNQAIYLANPTTRPALRGLVRNIGTGGVMVPYFTQSDGQEYLDGRPIFFTEFCPAIGTVGDLILAVWSEHLDGIYQGQQFAESMHARFLANERVFKFYQRNDGQWWWRSALTPRNGNTLSPCVVLATR